MPVSQYVVGGEIDSLLLALATLFIKRIITMATANSVTFQADKDTLFATAIQIIQEAGYIISETDDAARKIVYVADRDGGFMMGNFRFEVTITVSGASQAVTNTATTALYNIKAICITAVTKDNVFGSVAKANVKFENELIDFCINELRKQYQTVATTTTNSNAPGAGGQKSGCLIVLAFLGSLAAASGLGCLVFLSCLL